MTEYTLYRLDGQWYTIPSGQSPYISHEIYG